MNNSGKFQKYILNIFYVILPALSIVFFCDYNDRVYQIDKDYAVAKAVLAFMIYIFLIKKVRLFNWASLAITVALIPIHYLYRAKYILSVEIVRNLDVEIWSRWLFLMILVDIILDFRKKDLKKELKRFSLPAVILYLAMFIAMIICSHGRTEPSFLIIPLLMWFIVPISKDDYKNILYRFCDSWVVAFIYIVLKSFITNPYTGGRYYGSFVNIGAFGIFIGGCFAAAVFRLIDSKKRFGYKSYQFILSAVWMFLILIMTGLVNTRTLQFGILFNLIFFFISASENADRKKIIRRAVIVGSTILVGVAAIAVLAYLCRGMDSIKWAHRATKTTGFESIKAFVIAHLAALTENTTTFYTDDLKVGSLVNALDKLTSGRITLCMLFAKKITFLGSVGDGIQVGYYYAYNAHNAYIHDLYVYGILGGGLQIVWLIYSFVVLLKRWMKKRSLEVTFALCFLTALLGMMFGEIFTLYYCVMFFTMLSAKCVFYKENQGECEVTDLEEIDEEESEEYCYVLFDEEN
ncbi:MAG: hypothetical protein MJ123_00185 [Lachnospiraceae bacterium]|nr:hypothetical protein [Lachnospiraceae bacterium]